MGSAISYPFSAARKIWGRGECASVGCQVGKAAQLVGPAPTPHGALGGRQASAGCGPATVAFTQPAEGRMKAWPPHDMTSRRAPGDAA